MTRKLVIITRTEPKTPHVVTLGPYENRDAAIQGIHAWRQEQGLEGELRDAEHKPIFGLEAFADDKLRYEMYSSNEDLPIY